MQQYGVSPDKCSMATLKADPQWDLREIEALMGNGDEGGHRVADHNRWFLPPQDSYHYLMGTVPWAKRGAAGLFQQYFPWVKVPDQLLRLAAIRGASSTLAIYDGGDNRNILSNDWTRAMIRDGVGVITPLPVIPYDACANVRHSAIVQMASENGRLAETIKGPRDPLAQLPEYRVYCDELKEFREACMMRALQVMTPTAHINEPFKVILTWMGREVRRVGTFLPHYDMDPSNSVPEMLELDSFANFMIREALDVKHFRHIVSPIRHWQMSHYGAQDCHSTTKVDMHYSAIYHGPSQSSKSYTLKDSTVRKNVSLFFFSFSTQNCKDLFYRFSFSTQNCIEICFSFLFFQCFAFF